MTTIRGNKKGRKLSEEHVVNEQESEVEHPVEIEAEIHQEPMEFQVDIEPEIYESRADILIAAARQEPIVDRRVQFELNIEDSDEEAVAQDDFDEVNRDRFFGNAADLDMWDEEPARPFHDFLNIMNSLNLVNGDHAEIDALEQERLRRIEELRPLVENGRNRAPGAASRQYLSEVDQLLARCNDLYRVNVELDSANAVLSTNMKNIMVVHNKLVTESFKLQQKYFANRQEKEDELRRLMYGKLLLEQKVTEYYRLLLKFNGRQSSKFSLIFGAVKRTFNKVRRASLEMFQRRKSSKLPMNPKSDEPTNDFDYIDVPLSSDKSDKNMKKKMSNCMKDFHPERFSFKLGNSKKKRTKTAEKEKVEVNEQKENFWWMDQIEISADDHLTDPHFKTDGVSL